MTNRSVKWMVSALALGAVATLGGCSSTRDALGLNKVVPDEYRVVTKAPLVIPPDYALRPPSPGEPRPQELQPESAARQAMLGERDAITRSEGEKLLVAKAGAEQADPLARYVVDDEFGDLSYKEPEFADRILFWKKPATTETVSTNTVLAGEASAVDAASEAERVKTLVGDQKVVIQQKREKKMKLPGL